MDYFTNFFNSNFFQSIITLGVGSYAFIIYRKKINDNRRNIAKIIVSELRNADSIINSMKSGTTISHKMHIITINNWDANKHLFIELLDRDEYRCIDDYYNSAALIDTYSGLLVQHTAYQVEEKLKTVQQNIVNCAFSGDTYEQVTKKAEAVSKILEQPTAIMESGDYRKILDRELANISPVLTTSGFNKLKKASLTPTSIFSKLKRNQESA